MADFDIVVIGKGLVGTAAAKYLSNNGKKIAIIGPDEPDGKISPFVYASHYDETRVQRQVGWDDVWTRLNIDSCKEYESIQNETGIKFHSNVGCLYANAYGKDEYLEQFPEIAKKNNISYSSFDAVTNPTNHFSGFTFPLTSKGILETSPSGYINPRLLIQAQLEIFKNHGGTIISDTIVNLTRNSDDIFLLESISGKIYTAQQVLVATGSFMNYLNILPQKINLITKSEVVLLVKIEEDLVKHYSHIPSLLYEIDEEDAEGIYLIPPVKYPDGNYYIKIGCNTPFDLFFESLDQVKDWFQNGDADLNAPALRKALQKLLPNLSLENSFTKKCIISRTITERPYIGETIIKGLFLSGGCNGYSAMCSDAIGKVTSHFIMNGSFPSAFSEHAFEIIYIE